MNKGLCVLAACASLAGAAQADTRAASSQPPVAVHRPGLNVAQACGYFAILGCYRDPGSAEDWNGRIEFGHVIDTSSANYPNFRPGWYCVVHGPTSRSRAEDIARGWRRFIPDAYVKPNC